MPLEIEDGPQEDEKDYLEPTLLAVEDAAYDVDGNDDDLLDLGIQLGKMRITERIGGFFRPKISQEVGLGFFFSFGRQIILFLVIDTLSFSNPVIIYKPAWIAAFFGYNLML